MRYELSDYEWTAIKPMLPNKPRGVRRVNDRRVLNGIFWVLRSGAPWRDLPENDGPRTTCYNRFVRWRRAGVWDRIMDALAAGCDAAVQIVDTSVVRVHQHGACIADNNHQDMGRSRGGLTSKIHAVVDTNGLPVHLALTPGEAHDNRLCSVLLSALLPQTMLLADRGYDADWIRELARQQGAWANIPPIADQLAPSGGALPSEKVEQSADGREQAPPRGEHRMYDAAARLPLRQDMDKTPGADVFPGHDSRKLHDADAGQRRLRRSARRSLRRSGAAR